MMRVAADANTYVSALMFGGLPGAFLDLAMTLAFELVASPALLDELDEKLLMKFEVLPEDVAAIRTKLETIARIVKPDNVQNIIKDDLDDNRVLECAAAGKVAYVVSAVAPPLHRPPPHRP